MADTKISALTAASVAAGANEFAINEAGTSKKVTGTQIKTFCSDSPTLVTPALGTPASGVLTSCTGTAAGLTAGSCTTIPNLTGAITSSGNATTIKKDHSVLIMAPVETDDVPLHRFDVAATLVKVVYTIAGSTNWVGQIQEANDGIGTSAADTQSANSTVTTTTTVTSFSNASFDAGDFAYLKTTSVSGTPTYLHITFYYTES